MPLPPWLKARLGSSEASSRVRAAARNLHTVCSEARCPNAGECWSSGTATFLVLGGTCTRACRFCSVPSSPAPAPPDPAEPGRLAEAVTELGLRFVVLTTVCRDDLPDQGAAHAAECIRRARRAVPGAAVEFLSQDFRGEEGRISQILEAGPAVFAHNIETVERLTPRLRDRRSSYRTSLGVLAAAARLSPGLPTKSSLMLGLGETDAEVRSALADLLEAGVRAVTLGQYLRPGLGERYAPVSEFVEPERFSRYESLALEMGFSFAAAGPLVRSSYRAADLFLSKPQGGPS
jgi:lipoic acid synthetase